MGDVPPVTCQSIEALPLNKIFASPHQMRRHFDKQALRELADSMKQEGLIQPITVRKVGGAYELVVGERRLRAAQILGWATIDARVIDITDEDAAIKGLIENLQRTDLSPIEEAKGYKQLVESPYKMTQEAIAQRVGKSQTAIARALALLELPLEIQDLMTRGIVTETHTRSIRKISNRAKQVELARQADRGGWTVKETERRVKDILKRTGEPILLRAGKERRQSPDPLRGYWGPILDEPEGEVKLSNVRYEGEGRWTLKLEASATVEHKTALANFLIDLGQTLKGPVPKDLPSSSSRKKA